MSGNGASPAKKLTFVDPATFTPQFSWKKQRRVRTAQVLREAVTCEGVRLVDVADKIGTPAYVYSRAAIDDAQARTASRAGLAAAHALFCGEIEREPRDSETHCESWERFRHCFGRRTGDAANDRRSRRPHCFFGRWQEARGDSRGASISRRGNRKHPMATGAAFFSSTLNRKQSSKFCSKRRHEAWIVAANRRRFDSCESGCAGWRASAYFDGALRA